jgi:hypothetical protein
LSVAGKVALLDDWAVRLVGWLIFGWLILGGWLVLMARGWIELLL